METERLTGQNLTIVRYVNHYHCTCGAEWSDEWCCACNDRCPVCDMEIEPHDSDETETFTLRAGVETCDICGSAHDF